MLTVGHASLCALIDGRRSRDDLLDTIEVESDRSAAISILDWLEKMGLAATGSGPIAWLGAEPPDLMWRLAALRDGPARGMAVVPTALKCPVHVAVVPGDGAGLPVELASWGGAAGTGVSVRAAATSCLFEVAERCSQMRIGDEAVEIAALAGLGDIAVHPDELLLDEAKASVHPAMSGTPIRPLDPNQKIAWIPATDLATGKRRWLPADYCYRSANRAAAAWSCPADSSGCAAGASMADVTVRGFLEAVERDAVGIWWFNRVHRRECPTQAPAIDAVAAWQRDRGRHFHLLDLTTDLGIPVRAAVSFEKSGRGIAVGFGAHFDPTIAAIRASLEMVQFQVMIDLSLRLRDRGLVQDASPSTKDAWSWFEGVAADAEPYLLPQPAEPSRPLSPPPVTTDAALDRCIEIAGDHCLELLFVEMTRPWIGIPAGRVIVPGLRSIKRRLGGGRLYDVPVKLGWLPAARTSAEFNPRDMVF